jgi:hypothetical protein
LIRVLNHRFQCVVNNPNQVLRGHVRQRVGSCRLHLLSTSLTTRWGQRSRSTRNTPSLGPAALVEIQSSKSETRQRNYDTAFGLNLAFTTFRPCEDPIAGTNMFVRHWRAAHHRRRAPDKRNKKKPAQLLGRASRGNTLKRLKIVTH